MARLSAVAVLAGATLTGTVVTATSAHAVYTVSLGASNTAASSGETVYVTAYASGDVGPTPWYIEIYNELGQSVAICGSGSTCTAAVSEIIGSHTYTAYVASYSTTAPPPNIQGQSNPITVTWGLNGSPTCQSTSGVVVCLTPTSQITSLTAYLPALVPGTDVRVAGWVDLYRFTVNSVVTTLPCVILHGAPNACDAAGGTRVSNLLTLVDTTVNIPSVTLVPIATIGICNATLTLTVNSIGINSAPAVTIC